MENKEEIKNHNPKDYYFVSGLPNIYLKDLFKEVRRELRKRNLLEYNKLTCDYQFKKKQEIFLIKKCVKI